MLIILDIFWNEIKNVIPERNSAAHNFQLIGVFG